MRLAMVIDLKRRIACYGCGLSCKAEHGTPPGARIKGETSVSAQA